MRKIASLSIATALIVGAGTAATASAFATDNSQNKAQLAQAGQPSVGMDLSTSKANVKLIQNFYAAFGKGDIAGAQKLVTDDFIMHVPGKGLNAGEYWGKDGLKTFITHILAYNGGTFTMSVPHFAVNGNTAYTREVDQLNRKYDPQRIWTLRFTMHYKIKAGLVSEAWTMPEDEATYDAYWTPPAGAAAKEAAAKASVIKAKAAASAKNSGSLLNGKDAISAKNVAFVNELYNTFWTGGSLDTLHKMFSDNVVVDVPGHSDISGTYQGWDGFLKFRQKVGATIANRYKLDVVDTAGDSKGGFAEEFIRMNRPWDPEVKSVNVVLYYTIRDGKIVKMEDIPVDTPAWENFFTNPNKK